MIVIAAALIGIFLGVRRAGKLQGSTLDKLQYGAAFGLGFALLGLFVTIFLERML